MNKVRASVRPPGSIWAPLSIPSFGRVHIITNSTTLPPPEITLASFSSRPPSSPTPCAASTTSRTPWQPDNRCGDGYCECCDELAGCPDRWRRLLRRRATSPRRHVHAHHTVLSHDCIFLAHSHNPLFSPPAHTESSPKSPRRPRPPRRRLSARQVFHPALHRPLIETVADDPGRSSLVSTPPGWLFRKSSRLPLLSADARHDCPTRLPIRPYSFSQNVPSRRALRRTAVRRAPTEHAPHRLGRRQATPSTMPRPSPHASSATISAPTATMNWLFALQSTSGPRHRIRQISSHLVHNPSRISPNISSLPAGFIFAWYLPWYSPPRWKTRAVSAFHSISVYRRPATAVRDQTWLARALSLSATPPPSSDYVFHSYSHRSSTSSVDDGGGPSVNGNSGGN